MESSTIQKIEKQDKRNEQNLEMFKKISPNQNIRRNHQSQSKKLKKIQNFLKEKEQTHSDNSDQKQIQSKDLNESIKIKSFDEYFDLPTAIEIINEFKKCESCSQKYQLIQKIFKIFFMFQDLNDAEKQSQDQQQKCTWKQIQSVIQFIFHIHDLSQTQEWIAYESETPEKLFRKKYSKICIFKPIILIISKLFDQEKLVNQYYENKNFDFLQKNSDQNLEYFEEIVKLICNLIIQILNSSQNFDHSISSEIKYEFGKILKYFIDFIKRSFKFSLVNQTIQIQNLMDQKFDDLIDYMDKEQICKIFRNKQLMKIDKYIKHLKEILQIYLFKDQIKFDKQLIQKVFNGDSTILTRLIKDLIMWLLEKTSFDFTQDQILYLLDFILKYNSLFISSNNEELVDKIDKQLQIFIRSQDQKFQNKLNLLQKYGNIFFYGNQDNQRIDEIAKVQACKINQKELIIRNQKQNKFANLLISLKEFIKQCFIKFQKANRFEYQEIDLFIVDFLKQFYLKNLNQLSGRGIVNEVQNQKQLSQQIFQIIDEQLSQKMQVQEALNYKKILAAIQKSKLMHPAEIEALFGKANKFLSKDSFQKEKKQIKKEIQEQVILDGTRSSQNKNDNHKIESQNIEGKKILQKNQTNVKKEIQDKNDLEFEDAQQVPIKYLKNFKERIYNQQEQKYESKHEEHKKLLLDASDTKVQEKLKKIEEMVKKVYNEQKVQNKDLEIRDQVINRIKEAFYEAKEKEFSKENSGEILIQGFGSCHNGLWSIQKSDIDITAIFFDKLTQNHHKILKNCIKIISKTARKGSLVFVPAKKVPILKFIDDESGFQVDFNVNNLLGIINSNLIFTYVQIDHRFHIMNVFLKWWAKSVGILGASNGYLSSYALTLMIIAFLQNTQPPVLPCLQEKILQDQKSNNIKYPVSIDELESKRKKSNNQNQDLHKNIYCMCETDAFFENDLKIIKDYYMPKEENKKSVSELIYEFLYFYVYEFDTSTMVINIKEKWNESVQLVSKNGQNIEGRAGFSRKFQKDKYPFSIVDPFEVLRNPGCTLQFQTDQHKKTIAQFRAAIDKFNVYN